MTNLTAPLTHANEVEHRRRLAQTANAAYALAQQAIDKVDPVEYYLDTFTASANQSVFTLTAVPPSIGSLDVSVNGVTQINGADFNVNGSTLTFAFKLAAGDEVSARYSNKAGNYTVHTTTAGQTVFPVGFPILSLASLDVSVDGLTVVNGVDFDVIGADVVFTDPLGAGKNVLIRQTGEPFGTPAYRLKVETASPGQTVIALDAQPTSDGAVDISVDGLSVPFAISGASVVVDELDGGEIICVRYALPAVLGALPAIADAEAGTEIATINAILSVLRTHGLINE